MNPIVMRVTYRGERRDIFTGLKCPPEYWMPDMYLVSPKFKSESTINRNLIDMQTNGLQAFNILKMRDEEFTLDELVDAIKGKTPPPQTIMEYVLIKEKEPENKRAYDIAVTTWYKYQRCIRYFKDFMADNKGIKNIPVSKIDDVFVMEFFTFLQKE